MKKTSSQSNSKKYPKSLRANIDRFVCNNPSRVMAIIKRKNVEKQGVPKEGTSDERAGRTE